MFFRKTLSLFLYFLKSIIYYHVFNYLIIQLFSKIIKFLITPKKITSLFLTNLFLRGWGNIERQLLGICRRSYDQSAISDSKNKGGVELDGEERENLLIKWSKNLLFEHL